MTAKVIVPAFFWFFVFGLHAHSHPINFITRPAGLMTPESQGGFLKGRGTFEIHNDPGVLLTPDLNVQPPNLQPVISPLVQTSADVGVQLGVTSRIDIFAGGPIYQPSSPDSYVLGLKWQFYGNSFKERASSSFAMAVEASAGWGYATSFGESAALIAPYTLNSSQEEAGLLTGYRLSSEVLFYSDTWIRRIRANGAINQLQPSVQSFLLDGSGQQVGESLGCEYDGDSAGFGFFVLGEIEIVTTSWSQAGSGTAGAFALALGMPW